MNREDVIRQIVERDIQNRGLTEEQAAREVPLLHAAACEHFGTWVTALQYAGISERRITADDELSPERVLRRIRTLCIDGYDLSCTRNLRRDRRLYEAARQHFGTWRRALLAAGINLANARSRPKSRRLDRPQILQALRQRHEAGLSMYWITVCLDNRYLAMSAKHAFRSWRRALLAAGLPLEVAKSRSKSRWSHERILEDIQLRHQQGKPLKCARVFEEDPALVNATHRLFGSWREALVAAGVVSTPGV